MHAFIVLWLGHAFLKTPYVDIGIFRDYIIEILLVDVRITCLFKPSGTTMLNIHVLPFSVPALNQISENNKQKRVIFLSLNNSSRNWT